MLRHHEAASQPENGWRFQRWLATDAKHPLNDKKDDSDCRNRADDRFHDRARAYQHAADARKEKWRRVPRPGLSKRVEHQDPRSWQTPWATRIGFWSVQGQENDIVRAGYLMDGLTADVTIVEETYDQMDCTMRSLIRQQKPSSHPQNLDEALTATASSSTRNATRRTQQLNLS
jgi:hypothetical protein